MSWGTSLAPLRYRNFRWYFWARAANLAGMMTANVALAFAVLEIGGTAASVGQVLAAHTVPMIIILLGGGVIADRFPRAQVIQIANLGSALSQGLLSALVISGHAQIWTLVVLTACNGAFSGAAFPALTSILPQLTPAGELQRANALMSLARGVVSIVGPAFGAFLVGSVGAGWALAVDATAWLASALLMLPVRVPAPTTGEPSASTLTDLREGWQMFRSTTWLWLIVIAFSILNMIDYGAIYTLGPVVAAHTIGAQGWGLAMSGQAIGTILVTIALLKVPLRRPLLIGMLGMSTLSFPIALLAVHPHLNLLLPAMVIAGAGMELMMMGWNLALQEHIDPRKLSRAYSYDALGSFVAMPIGQLTWGPIAEITGLTKLLLASAATYLTVCTATLASSDVRKLARKEATPSNHSTITAPG